MTTDSDTENSDTERKPVEPKPCVECENALTFGPYICDDCLGQMMMSMVRKYERIAREHRSPEFRRLAFDTRKEMRELGVSP